MIIFQHSLSESMHVSIFVMLFLLLVELLIFCVLFCRLPTLDGEGSERYVLFYYEAAKHKHEHLAHPAESLLIIVCTQWGCLDVSCHAVQCWSFSLWFVSIIPWLFLLVSVFRQSPSATLWGLYNYNTNKYFLLFIIYYNISASIVFWLKS